MLIWITRKRVLKLKTYSLWKIIKSKSHVNMDQKKKGVEAKDILIMENYKIKITYQYGSEEKGC